MNNSFFGGAERFGDEFAFRWNHRQVSDGERVAAAVAASYGKRLVYQAPASS